MIDTKKELEEKQKALNDLRQQSQQPWLANKFLSYNIRIKEEFKENKL